MKKFTKKVLELIITLFIISLLTFIGFEFAKSDAAVTMLGVDAPESRLVALCTELGLDKPIIIRYFKYIQGVLQGDFGQSYLYKLPVMEVLYDKILVTLTVSILLL